MPEMTVTAAIDVHVAASVPIAKSTARHGSAGAFARQVAGLPAAPRLDDFRTHQFLLGTNAQNNHYLLKVYA